MPSRRTHVHILLPMWMSFFNIFHLQCFPCYELHSLGKLNFKGSYFSDIPPQILPLHDMILRHNNDDDK